MEGGDPHRLHCAPVRPMEPEYSVRGALDLSIDVGYHGSMRPTASLDQYEQDRLADPEVTDQARNHGELQAGLRPQLLSRTTRLLLSADMRALPSRVRTPAVPASDPRWVDDKRDTQWYQGSPGFREDMATGSRRTQFLSPQRSSHWVCGHT